MIKSVFDKKEEMLFEDFNKERDLYQKKVDIIRVNLKRIMEEKIEKVKEEQKIQGMSKKDLKKYKKKLKKKKKKLKQENNAMKEQIENRDYQIQEVEDSKQNEVTSKSNVHESQNQDENTNKAVLIRNVKSPPERAIKTPRSNHHKRSHFSKKAKSFPQLRDNKSERHKNKRHYLHNRKLSKENSRSKENNSLIQKIIK